MKNLKIWSIALMLVMAVSACGEKEPQHNGPVGGGGDIAALVNEWVISSYNDAAPEFVVYIDFNEDGTFAMYQQVYSLNYVCYTGSYNVSDDILTGTYADGTKWASAYKVSVSTDGKTLMMSSQEDVENMSVVSVYSQTVIPEDVKLEASETRALEVVPFL